jgi:formylglycine-generating enzyme required for sulfatase activity
MYCVPRIRLATKAWILFGTLICFSVFAQVSSSEGLSPIEGVVIPKAQTSEPQIIKPGAVFKDCDECPEMVVIPACSFLMGSPPDAEPDPFSNPKSEKIGSSIERPQHRVQIQLFAIGLYEVTQEQWFAVMGNNPSSNKGRKLPVEQISWDDAQLFVQKLSRETGKKYRLPSEAEWEYAARAGSTTTYPWGNSRDNFDVYAWHNQVKLTQQVRLKKPNQFGLHDMIGNVWEWTQDCWNGNYIGAPTDGSAWTRGDCYLRVLRGSGIYLPNGLRSSERVSFKATSFYKGYGFRVARDL